MKQQHIRSSWRKHGLPVILGIGLSVLSAAGAQAQTYAPYVNNPFNLTGLGDLVEAEFADIDNDGDLDLFTGSSYGSWGSVITLFENTGTRIAPHFAAPVANPFGFPFIGGLLSPSFVDIDNDGDLDLFCGTQSGESIYFENTGTPSAPVFAAPVTDAFDIYDVGYLSSHAFTDIDNDGDKDVLIGEYYGGMYFYPNIGTAEAPNFGPYQTLPFGLSNVGQRPKPAFMDMDKDGDQDLLVGLENGSLVYFQNTGTLTAPAFAAPVINPFGLTNVGTMYASPSPVDLDLDGDLDIFCSDNSAVFNYFENTSPLPQPPNAVITTPASDLTVCYGSGAILTAAGTPIGTIGWYDSPTGGNRLGGGSPFVTAPVTGTTTFYAQDSTGGGISPGRVAVTVTVTQAIVDQTVSAAQASVCAGGSTVIHLNGSESGLTYYLRNNLNDTVIGAPAIGTGNALAFNTGALPVTTTYHVLAEKGSPIPHHALAFDGSNDYITAPAVDIANHSFTVEFWAKRIPNGGDNYVIGQQSTQSVNHSLHIGFRSGNSFTFAFYGNDLDVPTAAATDQNFHHWSCVFIANQAGTNRFIYLDGNLVASDEAPANYSGNGPLHIGTVPFAPAYFNGTIDELKIWNQARTATEVQQDMVNNSLSGNEPGLLAYYTMDETVGTTTLLDKTGHNNDGTLQNMNVATAWVTGDNTSANYRVCQIEMGQPVTVTANPPALRTESITLCHGENYLYADGTSALVVTSNQSHVSTFAGQAANGCDSIVTENLIALPLLTGSVTTTLCAEESVTINGTVYDASHPSGTEVFTSVGTQGCDSTVTVNLTVLPALTGSVSTTLCAEESITINGTVYDASHPSGTEVFSNAGTQGCDSTVSVNLTVLPALTGSVTTTLCAEESITINGTVYDASHPSGTEVFTNAGIQGCDSTVAVNLTILPALTGSVTTTLCAEESITINGTVYDASHPSGTEVFTNAGTQGCDSTVSVNLTVLPVLTGSVTTTLCAEESITINGTVYDASHPSGTEVFTNVGTQGCDSTVAVNLTILPALTGSVTAAICVGESITVNGTVYDASHLSGTEVFTNAGPNGCDSTVTVSLSLNPSVDISTTTTAHTITANQSGAGYQWIDCTTNTLIAGATAQTFAPTQNGSYAVAVTDVCSDTSECVAIVTLGIQQLSPEVLFNAYPNPTNGAFTIDVTEPVSLRITNATGQLILTRSVLAGKTTIETENVPSGLYFISATDNTNHKRIATKQLVITK